MLVGENKFCNQEWGGYQGWAYSGSLTKCVSRCKGAGLAVYREDNGKCKCCDMSYIDELLDNDGSNVYEIIGERIFGTFIY